MKDKWLFVVSASNSVGRGHLNRSIALALEISNKIDVDFYSNDKGKFYKEIKNKNIKFYSFGLSKINLKRYLGVVIDIKNNDKTLIKKLSIIKNSAIICDHNTKILDIKTIISPAFEKRKFIASYQTTLLGKKYYLINTKYKNCKKKINKVVKNILINFGYLDSKHLTLKVLDQLNCNNYQKKVTVVIGKNPSLVKKIKKNKYKFKLKIYFGLKDLRFIYKKVDICIGAGGVGMLERFLYSIPSVTIMSSDDQYYAILMAKKKKATLVLKYENEKKFSSKFKKILLMLFNKKKRIMLRNKSYQYLDNKGSYRVAKYLLSHL